MIKIKKYPFTKQEDIKDCGAACLSMLIKYYKGFLSMEKIKELVYITKEGTTAFHIIEGAKKLGFNANGYNCEFKLFKEEKIMFPCIANVVMNKSYSHFIVIYNINYYKKELIIADPANKIMKISFDNFQSIYTGTILILYPEKKLPYTSETKFSIKNIMYLLEGARSFLINIFVLSFFIIIYSILSSFYAQFMLNAIQNGDEFEKYIFLFIIFSIITVLKTLGEYFRDQVFIYLMQKVELILTMDIFHKILSLPYRYYRNHTTGDILSRINEASVIRDTICKWIIVLIIDIPLMIISICLIYSLNFSLALLSLISFLIFIVILRLFQHPLEDSIEACQIASSELSSVEVENISAFESIKSINLELVVKRKLEKYQVKFLEKLYTFRKLNSIQSGINELIYNISYFTIFLIGCLYVKDEKITFGSLLTFQSLFGYFITPVKQLVELDGETKKSKKAFNRLTDLYVEEDNNGFLISDVKGKVAFKNLSYSYDSYKLTLKNINLEIEDGEKIIIIGHSGSGKSTLFKILKGFYPIDRGLIEVNKNDINDYKNKDAILYINQSEMLFTDTLYNNIVFDKKTNEIDISEIMNICEVDNIIKNKNLGYSLLIEENGFNLSGGERQRIVLARTLLKNFNILVIDEGLSQLDVDSERRILLKIFRKFKDKTIIIISHRLENLDLFNRTIKMKNGSIIEDVIKNGKYRTI